MKILITGGAGFIGHHIVEHFLRNTEHSLVLLDRLDHSGNLNRLDHLHRYRDRMRFLFTDLRAELNTQLREQIGSIEVILHLAAGTHVDRSITDPLSFVYDNVVGTANLLEFARHTRGTLRRFIYFSTDEVFGPAPPGVAYREDDRYRSGNPYAATKAGAEELCMAYANTYALPVIVTHCMNVFGERQHPEKFIPMVTRKVRDGEVITIHASPEGVPGSRFYIHARNVAAAIQFLLARGSPGEKYNIVGEREVNNYDLANMIAGIQMQNMICKIVDFHSSRPGHDLRYALDGSKMAALGWRPPVSLDEGLERTVRWSLNHPEWL